MRTSFDLARHLPLIEAVVAVDMALRHTLVHLDDLSDYVADHDKAQGSAQARRVVELAEPRAESPMESRLRALLVLAGLPRPRAQAEVCDRYGRFLGRLDLYYPKQRLGLEYDGETHRHRLVADNRRQNRLLAAGYRLLRFTAADVYRRPDGVVAEVRAALQA
jgi:very-short-patch-repair endonuclease